MLSPLYPLTIFSHYGLVPWTTTEALPWDSRHPHWQLLEVCSFRRSWNIEGIPELKNRSRWLRPRPFCPIILYFFNSNHRSPSAHQSAVSQFWHVGSCAGRNQSCQISTRSVQGFRSPRWPKIAISHWLEVSPPPLQHCNVLHCDACVFKSWDYCTYRKIWENPPQR